MVCGIVLGKEKTTKLGRVWYELNIVNQLMNEVGIELLGQLKKRKKGDIVPFWRLPPGLNGSKGDIFCLITDKSATF